MSGKANPVQSVFFVTGLPRSRTTWLANLLTYGQTFCHHDLMNQVDSLNSFHDRLTRPDVPCVGNSDSGLLLVHEKLMRLYPKAKWIIVLRNKEQALESYWKYFTRHPYRNQVPLNREQLEAAYELFHNRLCDMGSYLSKYTHVVDYPSLNRPQTYFSMLKFLGPIARGQAPKALLMERWQMLNCIAANPASDKIDLDHKIASQWVEQALKTA